MSQPEIVPIILTDDQLELKDKISRLGGKTRRLQIDVVDGVFAPNKSLALPALNQIAALADFQVELHLLVKEPLTYLWACRQVPGIDLVVAQIEMMSNQAHFLETAWQLGLRAGLGLKLKTDIEAVEPGLLAGSDQILLLAVKAGFSGQPFDRRVLPKIKRCRELAGDETEIFIDGGINLKTAPQAAAAGADSLGTNSFVWQGQLSQQLRELKKRVKQEG